MRDVQKIAESLDLLGMAQLEAKECFGCSVAVSVNGETVINKNFGDASFNDKSLYRLASVTKIISAVALMKLYDDRKIDIYAPVSDYIPSFKKITLGSLGTDGKVQSLGLPMREITLFDLLTHTAGLGADSLGSREYDTMPTEEKVSLKSVTDYYAENFHLAFEPGKKAAYSGFAGYDVPARIAEIVTGKSFNEYLCESVCAPLGMTDTTFQPTDEQYARLVPMHRKRHLEDVSVDFKGAVFRGLARSYEAAGASLVSSAKDMLRFANMLLSKGEGILRPETVEKMLSPALREGLCGLLRGENNGIGCFVISGEHRLPRGTVYSHGAYGPHLILHPESGLAAIFLKNSLYDMSLTSHSTVQFERAVFG